MTANQASLLHERRVALERHINRFRSLQSVYMPGVGIRLEATDRLVDGQAREAEAEALPVEVTSLFMPSGLTCVERENICLDELVIMEEKLREAECHDALKRMRAILQSRVHSIHHKNTNARGQRRLTRAQAIIDGLNQKIKKAVARYRRARAALLSLRGPGEWEQVLRELNDGDIREPGAHEFTIEDPASMTRSDGRELSAKAKANKEKGLGEGFRLISWIWMSGSEMLANEEGLNEILKVEWAKGRARMLRWDEEVLLLKEEMRRVLVFLQWKAKWWLARTTGWGGLTEELAEGISAYGHRQAMIQLSLRQNFMDIWCDPLVAAAEAIVVPEDGDTNTILEEAAPIEDDGVDGLDEGHERVDSAAADSVLLLTDIPT